MMNMNNQDEQLYKIRHSAAHVMAEAVLEVYPQAKIAIGPPIDDGFYYDFDLGVDEDGRTRTFSPEDLEAIEKRMRQLIGGKHEFVYREVSATEARAIFADQPYKLELIQGLERGDINALRDAYRTLAAEEGTFRERARALGAATESELVLVARTTSAAATASRPAKIR